MLSFHKLHCHFDASAFDIMSYVCVGENAVKLFQPFVVLTAQFLNSFGQKKTILFDEFVGDLSFLRGYL